MGPGHKVAGCGTLWGGGAAQDWCQLISVQPGSEIGGCRARLPGSSVSLLVGGAGS